MTWLRGPTFHGIVAVEHDRRAVVRFLVKATSLRAATLKAFNFVSDASATQEVSKNVLALRVRPTGEDTYLPELVGLTEIARMLGVSRQRAGQLARSVGFPSPVADLAMGPVFVAHAVSEFAREHGRTVRK
jgi:hypothetical protein